MSYKVSAAENPHYMDEDEWRTAGFYDGIEEALAACRYIIDRSLRELDDDRMRATELFRLWAVMGEDAWVVPLRDGLTKAEFSGRDYARLRSEDICQGR
jgi:hypothetical protein